MGTAIYRVTGIVLSLMVIVFGAAVSGLLFYAGTEVLNKNITFIDELRKEHRYFPKDDLYDNILQYGWMLGLVYLVPGVIGFTASLFLIKCFMIFHVIVTVVLLIAGSVLHTAFAMAVLIFWLLTTQEIINYDEWLYDCIYIRYRQHQDKEKIHECETGRMVFYLGIATAAVCFIAWVFVLLQLLFVSFTYNSIGKMNKTPVVMLQQIQTEQTRLRDDRPRRRPDPRRRRAQRAPQSTQTTETEIPPGQNTPRNNLNSQHESPTRTNSTLNTTVPQIASTSTTAVEISPGRNATRDNMDIQNTPTLNFSTFRKRKTDRQTVSAKEYVNKAYDAACEDERKNTNAETLNDKRASDEIYYDERTAL